MKSYTRLHISFFTEFKNTYYEFINFNQNQSFKLNKVHWFIFSCRKCKLQKLSVTEDSSSPRQTAKAKVSDPRKCVSLLYQLYGSLVSVCQNQCNEGPRRCLLCEETFTRFARNGHSSLPDHVTMRRSHFLWKSELHVLRFIFQWVDLVSFFTQPARFISYSGLVHWTQAKQEWPELKQTTIFFSDYKFKPFAATETKLSLTEFDLNTC